jgi:LCP family protein required for cell wall assembly
MVVASVDASHQNVSLVALPRDTVDIPLADGSLWRGKVNGLMATFGIEGLRGALATTYGIPIDYYMTIDMSDFGRLITAIGGVQVDVEKPLFDGGLGFSIQPGTQVLDANSALSYVRTRVDTDYGRNRRQQQMVVALARQLLAPNQPVNVPELVTALSSVETDIPLEAMPTFMQLIGLSLNAQVSTQVLGPPQFALFEGIEAGPRGWVMIPNVPEIRAYVQSVMGN